LVDVVNYLGIEDKKAPNWRMKNEGSVYRRFSGEDRSMFWRNAPSIPEYSDSVRRFFE